MKTVIVLPFTMIFACALAFAESDGARTVKYDQRDIVEIHAKVRFSTLIVLPPDEDILDFTTGTRTTGLSTAPTTCATCTQPLPTPKLT